MDKDNALPLISVLMPVYNVKEYIDMAIESVLNQTYPNFELVIINDGSTDGSGRVAEDYQHKDSRVRVYHISNGGLANARNLAISYAQGEYISFVDSDDCIKEDYLECLYQALVKYDADISFCSYYRYVEEEKMYYFPILEEGYEEKIFTPVEAYQNYYNPTNSYNISLVVIWGKLIRKKLFTDLTFPNGKLHEDAYTTYKLYFLTDKIVYVKKHLYMYRIRPNSITTKNWSRERLCATIEQHEERISLLTAMGVEITESNRLDYIATLENCASIALENGFIDEYKAIRQKLVLIYRGKTGNFLLDSPKPALYNR